MRYDPEYRSWPRRRPRGARGGYDSPYPASPGHGWAMGYDGGALRSRGSFEAEPWDEPEPDEFIWGGGYVGGRGYGGTNRDYEVGYRTSARLSAPHRRDFARTAEFDGGAGLAATEPGADWQPVHHYRPQWSAGEEYGPARYGYGPYYDRLQRRRRGDDEIQEDVEDALFYDTWVDADAIRVEVGEGIVTLEGTLPSYEEVRYATDDAWDVDGVRGVRARLTVGQRRPGADEAETETSAQGPGEPGGRAASRSGVNRAAPGRAEAGAGSEGESE